MPEEDSFFNLKNEARKKAKALLNSLDEVDAARRSTAASELLRATPEYETAECLLSFLSMKGEIDSSGLVDAALGEGKAVAVPRIDGEDIVFTPLSPEWRSWSRDRYGIPEPPALSPVLGHKELGERGALVLVPGLAFDRRGGRLGRGKGYYDRFLRDLRRSAQTGGGKVSAFAFCFYSQIVDEIPMGELDERVDAIVSDGGVIRVSA